MLLLLLLLVGSGEGLRWQFSLSKLRGRHLQLLLQ
jgi:hypothetical protein